MCNQDKKNEESISMEFEQTETNPCENDEQFLNRLAIQHKVLTELVKTKKTEPKPLQNAISK